MGLGREVSIRKFGSFHGEVTQDRLISYTGHSHIKVNRGSNFYIPQNLFSKNQGSELSSTLPLNS
jgi:hypothetical protein